MPLPFKFSRIMSRRRKLTLAVTFLLLILLFLVWMHQNGSSTIFGINKKIDNLEGEIHLPGYKFCGPGTKLDERLNRGDNFRNHLDASCLRHDIQYRSKDLTVRNLADLILIRDALIGIFLAVEEILSSLFVIIVMILKLPVNFLEIHMSKF